MSERKKETKTIKGKEYQQYEGDTIPVRARKPKEEKNNG